MINFDTSLYERPIRAPVVDTFDLGRAKVTADDLRDKWVPAANRRHNKGEHAQIVVGHTRDSHTAEVDQPPAAGILTGPFAFHADGYPGCDGPCMSGLHWIAKEREYVLDGVPLKLAAKELLERYPRRSGELWFTDYKIDPHCLLGATTPCREMGPLRLSRDGDTVVEREITYPLRLACTTKEPKMAEESKETPKPQESDTGVSKQLEALTQLVMSLQKQVEAMAGPAPGAAGGHGAHPDDAELEQLLAELGQSQGGNEPQPEPQKPTKMSAQTADVAALQTKVRCMEIREDLTKLGVDPDKSPLSVADLSIQPPDVYQKLLDVVKLSRAGANTAALSTVVAAGNGVVQEEIAAASTAKKKIATAEDREAIVRLSREKSLAFAQAAEQLGYETVVVK